MDINNTPRTFIKEICAEEGYHFEGLSQGYVLCITKDGISRHIFGPYWDLNSAAADRIACDKTACSTLLQNNNIPAIEHALLYNPLFLGEWADEEGVLSRALRYFEKHNRKLVIKPNKGTKGEDVYYCDTIHGLECAIQSIFKIHPDAALSPYVEIKTEYRVFYLNGKSHFAYGKKKGKSWQHNLSQGATAFEIPPNSEQNKKRLADLENLADRAAKCIGINFATIDIAESTSGERAIMEINSGIQARLLVDQHPHLRHTVKKIYSAAIKAMFTVKYNEMI
ncbi:MAG: ATP-grasp domain-containing protein [Defluviitaleaceae bacterium]|nr:ATP-grasp domain-containing protein [Defluviitaleaceae bacterium]